MILNATHHHGVIDPQVIIAALGAAAFLYARFKVTPVADPKDGNGQPLVAVAAVPSPPPRDPVDPGALLPPFPPPEKTLMPPAAPE
jgi:hypothetical protein